MELRWLTAEEQELEAAIEQLDEDERPEAESRSFVPAGIAHVALLVYFGVAWFVFAGGIDPDASPPVELGSVVALVVNMLVFSALWYATVLLGRWLDKPPRDAELRAWREHLTGLANDVEIEPVRRATFVSLITGDRRTASCRPRFTAPGVEFGNLTSRTHSVLEWHYLAVELPSPLPHLVLESTAAGSLPNELAREIGQQVSLGQPFDSRFTLYAPRGYEHDALYVMTPAVMAALLDHAAEFHVEIIGDTLVFFAPGHADFGALPPWQAIDALWMHAVPPLLARAQRYRDERVPEQAFAQRLLTFQEALTTPGYTWQKRGRRIAPAGRRMEHKRGTRWSMARKYGLEFVVYQAVMWTAFFAIFGVGFTIYRLIEVFTGG